jgi:DNA-binding GntR family transcriptional regulator
MSTSLNIADDLITVADGLEPLMLRRAASNVETQIAHALRRPVSKNESASSGGTVLHSDVRFHLPVVELSVAPATDDVLIDATGRNWTILQVKSATCATRWECLCRAE